MNTRKEAMDWLLENIVDWPESMDVHISGRIFKNWRFVDTLPEREIVFGNCIELGISKAEFELNRLITVVH